MKTVLFLGGNGHRPLRLEPVREVLAHRPGAFAIRDVTYPPAASFEQLLLLLADDIGRGGAVTLAYATGIGALVGLALRARGVLMDLPLLLSPAHGSLGPAPGLRDGGGGRGRRL